MERVNERRNNPEIIDPGSSGRKPGVDIEIAPDLTPDSYLNKYLNSRNMERVETEIDFKNKLNQILNNTNIEDWGYSYSYNITTGVVYGPMGLSRVRNVIGIQLNLNPAGNK